MTRRRASILTASDGVTGGVREDESGDILEKRLTEADYELIERKVVPDDRTVIAETLRTMSQVCDLLLTTGGTGFGPRDVTPEASNDVIDRPAPGLVHLLLAAGLENTPNAALSRPTAGTIGSCLVCNLPGSSRGVEEGLDALLPIVGHALDLLAGERPH